MSAFLRWQNQYPDRLQQVPLNLFWKRTQFGTGQDDGPDLSLASALGMPGRMGPGLLENLNPSLSQRPGASSQFAKLTTGGLACP